MKAPELPRSEQEVFVNKEIGSGSEDTILASDAETAATRGSVNRFVLTLHHTIQTFNALEKEAF